MTQVSIRWNEVRARLEVSDGALQQVLAGSPERRKAVFRQRATELAKEQVSQRPERASVQTLVVLLGTERYAIDLGALAEVLPDTGCTRVPGARAEFLGLINLRGELVPVVDLRRIMTGAPAGEGVFVLIVDRRTGLKVDDIEDLSEIHRDELTRPMQGRYVQGVAPGNIILLDIEALLSGVVSAKESRRQ